MESSSVPKIVRWRVYLQSFSFVLRHIPGHKNSVADYLSRMYDEDVSAATTLAVIEEDRGVWSTTQTNLDSNTKGISIQVVPSPLDNEIYSDPSDVLKRVQGGRMGHFGDRQTWIALNTYFPAGHKIPYRIVQEFVATCPVCQKDRLGMLDTIDPIVRHLRPPHPRAVVGAILLLLLLLIKMVTIC
jgi:hypothetical protein